MSFLSSTLKHTTAAIALTVAALPFASSRANADANPFLGELELFGGNFCPRGWIEADGQLLPINQYQALFSLFGTMYGGDGRTTFGLPELRGRTAIHVGSGPGLPYPGNQGARGGTTQFTLTVAQMPSHNHNVNAVGLKGNKGGPGTDFLAIPEHYNQASTDDDISIYHNGPPDKVMDPAMLTYTGGNQSVSHRGPYQVLRWCVSLQGVFPSRN